MKTIYSPGYHHNGFVTTHALGHIIYIHHCQKAIVVITRRAHCFHDKIYIMLIMLLWDLSTLCVVDHLWTAYILHIIYTYKYIYIYNFHSINYFHFISKNYIYINMYIYIYINMYIYIYIFIYIYYFFCIVDIYTKPT